MFISAVLCSSTAMLLNRVNHKHSGTASKMVGVEGVLVAWFIWAWLQGAFCQRAPCYQCEMYKESHPRSSFYTAIRAHCVYPCECGTMPECHPGVPVLRDGCGCCWRCAKQEGEPCDGPSLCDSSRNLTCVYSTNQDLTGTCQEERPAKCIVNNRTYDNGESFTLDCRTQCTCQNGTYACVSLCPSENILPSAQCHNPHLVTVPGQCCREWMCDTAPGQWMCDTAPGQWMCDTAPGQWMCNTAPGQWMCDTASGQSYPRSESAGQCYTWSELADQVSGCVIPLQVSATPGQSEQIRSEQVRGILPCYNQRVQSIPVCQVSCKNVNSVFNFVSA
ncbi:uncharacterized protein [Panulirus ornatus]|uniref:uncharacterized protein n=1 Tax=Panulirus ornatus TaxID=150431 RepID=UPI003A86BD87